PGFSTSEKITSVSGRGVGLDVVKKNLDAIHGRVEVQSEEGKFTRFIIRIPLTLAIIEGFVTKVGLNFYVFPFNQIEEIIVLQKENENFSKNGDNFIFYHRGYHIPVIFASKIFSEENIINNEKDFSKKKNSNIFAIIILIDQNRYCIVVDEVFGKQEIVIKNLGFLLSKMKMFSGGTIFGDGTIGFVVDTQALVENYE
ncbi:MAG: chemotaxis protein CheW, partial [Spirochaetota bacterium]